jgi:hypothetical protein
MSRPEPPRLARRLIEWALLEDQRDDIVGDLHEVYQRRWRARGPLDARASRRWSISSSISWRSSGVSSRKRWSRRTT